MSNVFEMAVDSTPDVRGHYMKGLTALKGNHRNRVKAKDTRELDGSVDIDAATAPVYPQEHRWDYAIGYAGKAHFVEVHPATTSEMETVLKKKAWQEKWLREKAPEIEKLKADHPYHWIASGRTAILQTSSQYKRLALCGLLPKSVLTL